MPQRVARETISVSLKHTSLSMRACTQSVSKVSNLGYQGSCACDVAIKKNCDLSWVLPMGRMLPCREEKRSEREQ